MIVCAIILLGILYLGYSLILMNTGKIDYANVSDGCKGVGAGFAFVLSWYIEPKYINFDTKCRNIWLQILKVIIGAAGIMLIRTGIKALFEANMIIDMIRYFLMLSWAMLAMPLIIKRFFQEKDEKLTISD